MARTQEVLLYDVFEMAFTHADTGSNPFRARVEASFFSEDGIRFQVDGFYDGEDTYKVRFMPVKPGKWTFRVTLCGRVAGKGEFFCIPSGIKGPLRQDGQHPYHFRFSNGDPYYMMGNTAYNALVAYRNKKEAFIAFLDFYSERRFNWTRFFLEHTTWPTLGGIIWPWGGTPETPDFHTFTLDIFREAEGVIKEMANRNMIASTILLHPFDESLSGLGSLKMTAVKEYIRYTVARLGAYWNVVWNVANEWQRGKTFTYDEMDELGYYLHTIDPYQRLTACHHYSRFDFFEKEWTDMSSMQHRGMPHEVNRVVLQNRKFRKITINEEYGYEQDTIAPPNDPDNVRHDHWAIAMAGGYGSYGDKTKGPKIAVYFSSVLEDAVGTVVPDMLKHLHSFMEKTGYMDMEPGNEFLSCCNPEEVFSLANPGKEYVIYLVKGQKFTLNLTHARGMIRAMWYNPRSGEYTPGEEVTIYWDLDDCPQGTELKPSSGGFFKLHNVEFTAPDTKNDWVLYLKAANEC